MQVGARILLLDTHPLFQLFLQRGSVLVSVVVPRARAKRPNESDIRWTRIIPWAVTFVRYRGTTGACMPLDLVSNDLGHVRGIRVRKRLFHTVYKHSRWRRFHMHGRVSKTILDIHRHKHIALLRTTSDGWIIVFHAHNTQPVSTRASNADEQ